MMLFNLLNLHQKIQLSIRFSFQIPRYSKGMYLEVYFGLIIFLIIFEKFRKMQGEGLRLENIKISSF